MGQKWGISLCGTEMQEQPGMHRNVRASWMEQLGWWRNGTGASWAAQKWGISLDGSGMWEKPGMQRNGGASWLEQLGWWTNETGAAWVEWK